MMLIRVQIPTTKSPFQPYLFPVAGDTSQPLTRLETILKVSLRWEIPVRITIEDVSCATTVGNGSDGPDKKNNAQLFQRRRKSWRRPVLCMVCRLSFGVLFLADSWYVACATSSRGTMARLGRLKYYLRTHF